MRGRMLRAGWLRAAGRCPWVFLGVDRNEMLKPVVRGAGLAGCRPLHRDGEPWLGRTEPLLGVVRMGCVSFVLLRGPDTQGLQPLCACVATNAKVVASMGCVKRKTPTYCVALVYTPDLTYERGVNGVDSVQDFGRLRPCVHRGVMGKARRVAMGWQRRIMGESWKRGTLEARWRGAPEACIAGTRLSRLGAWIERKINFDAVDYFGLLFLLN